jgi:diguanylate cyclase (GGDEF)-like protein
MEVPHKPMDEVKRLEALRALNVLDTSPEERFDRVTRLARRLFNVPMALVSLVDEDRQWFKSCQGLDASETSRDVSFCGHAILGEEVLVVPDAALDERFRDNPLVTGAPHIRFYAGCPLKVPNGSRVGTLCIIDREPRTLSEEDLASLRDLARMIEKELSAVQLATTDELTMISNRRGLEALSRHALGLCRRLGKPASLLFFDLDLFKQINDRFGHAEGDRALVAFAGLLRRTFRESDVLGRVGGDEFAVLLTDTGAEGLDKTLQRLQEAVDRHNQDERRGYDIIYSVGTVSFDAERHADFADLMHEADALMYARKVEARCRNRQYQEQAAHLGALAWG